MPSTGPSIAQDVQITTAGAGYTLVAKSTGLADGISEPFNITHGVAKKVGVTSDPDGTYTADNTTISLTAAIQDAYGNTVTTGDDATASVNLALSGGNTTTFFGTHPKRVGGHRDFW